MPIGKMPVKNIAMCQLILSSASVTFATAELTQKLNLNMDQRLFWNDHCKVSMTGCNTAADRPGFYLCTRRPAASAAECLLVPIGTAATAQTQTQGRAFKCPVLLLPPYCRMHSLANPIGLAQ